MIIIAHRGNLNGPSPLMENQVPYVDAALKAGFDVEVDVWSVAGQLYLGHDGPNLPVQLEYLVNLHLWCHAKNIEALHALLKGYAHCFYHQGDDAVLTSGGYVWTLPGRPVYQQSVCVLPERHGLPGGNFVAVCTDYPVAYRELLKDAQ